MQGRESKKMQVDSQRGHHMVGRGKTNNMPVRKERGYRRRTSKAEVGENQMIEPDIHFTDTDNDDEFIFEPEDESEEE
jgi:hypothetical protein